MTGAGLRGNAADRSPLMRNYRGYRSVPVTSPLPCSFLIVHVALVACLWRPSGYIYSERSERTAWMLFVVSIIALGRIYIMPRLHHGVLVVVPVCHLLNVTISSGHRGLGNTHTSHCGQFI